MHHAPEPNSLWRFTAPKAGHGEFHRVVTNEEGDIVTIGQNYSWYGFITDFLQEFQFVQAPTAQ